MSTETIELQNLDAILAQHRAERASDWLEADFFTFFVSEQLLKNTGASVEEVVDSIVDGGNDCGVDSITYLINESPAGRYPDLHSLPSEIRMQIIIVQSKSGLSFEERPLLEMATRLPQLFDSTRDEDDVALWVTRHFRSKLNAFSTACLCFYRSSPTFLRKSTMHRARPTHRTQRSSAKPTPYEKL